MLKLGIIFFIVCGGVVMSLFHQLKDQLGVVEKVLDRLYTSFTLVFIFIGYLSYGGKFVISMVILYFATALVFSLLFALAFKLFKN